MEVAVERVLGGMEVMMVEVTVTGMAVLTVAGGVQSVSDGGGCDRGGSREDTGKRKRVFAAYLTTLQYILMESQSVILNEEGINEMIRGASVSLGPTQVSAVSCLESAAGCPFPEMFVSILLGLHRVMEMATLKTIHVLLGEHKSGALCLQE
ncbi:Hypothetical predicted protein [Lynx pardinus]|uniref:Uncharacterized protein n=1 Tax=Lynx pardinus TaxID=191816 RepID=A0A485NL04_LYNPA|nr:Hypothetical predicted protein [Lynx pardinus]